MNLQDDVGMLRQHFVPTHAFEHAVILRGTFLPLRTTYGSKRGVLLLWKKKDVSQMCVLDTHSLDLRHLKPNQWTCVFLWNSNGNMPVNPDVPDEMLIPKSSRTLCCFCKFTANSMAKFTANAMSTTKLTLETCRNNALKTVTIIYNDNGRALKASTCPVKP